MNIKGLFSSGKKNIAQWFIDEKQPFYSRRLINLKNFIWVGGSTLVFLVLIILFTPTSENRSDSGSSDQNTSYPPGRGSDPTNGSAGNSSGPETTASYKTSIPARSRNANQVIRRSSQNSDSIGMVAMGSAIGARLMNTVVSANMASPVIASLQDDSQKLPAGSKAIGSASFDEQSHRMMIHFSTIIYPDGEQHSVQAIAMMPDGSAGLDGDYHSGETKRQVGRFLGYFIGGMADGMKERSQGSMLGGPFEPGSIKNGVLGGISQSAQDQAHQYSDSMSNEHASMSISSGMEFVFYFEHEFNP